MSKFTVCGYILDTEVIYLDEYDDAVSISNHGAGSGELFVSMAGVGNWTLVKHDAESYVKSLNPIAVVDPTLKLERDLESMYEVGKVYAFSDHEDSDANGCIIETLSSIHQDDDYPFLDMEGGLWKFAREVPQGMLGKVKG